MADYLPPVVTELKGEIGDLAAKVEEAKRLIDSLDSKDIKIEVKEDLDKTAKDAKDAERAMGDLGRAVKRTSGAVDDAINTDNDWRRAMLEVDRARMAAQKGLVDINNHIRELDREMSGASNETHRFRDAWKGLFTEVNKGLKQTHGGFFRNLGGAVEGVFRSMKTGLKDILKGARDVGRGLKDLGSVMFGTAQEGITLSSSLSKVGTGLMGMLTGLAEAGPGALAVLGAIATVIIPIGAGISGLVAALGALTAGALGIGALALVAIPTIKSLAAGISQLNNAQQQFTTASHNLNIGLRTSKQDMAQYKTVLGEVDGNLRGAVKLLRDSHARWIDLSAAQRRSVVALSENKQALKDMSPAMRQALQALLAQKTAYNNLTPAQRHFAVALNGLSAQWHKLQAAAEPVITLLLTDLTQLAKDALPLVLPLINATGNALHRLLLRADTFVKSEQFKAWIKKVTQEIPGVIQAVGNFIAKLAALIGPLITNQKNLADLNNTFRILVGILHGVISTLNFLSKAFSYVKFAAQPVIDVIHAISSALGTLVGLASSAAGAIRNVLGLGNGLGFIGHLLGGFAVGTASAPSGWHWVGERGPELMRFRGGEQVLPHGVSMAVSAGTAVGGAAGGAGGGVIERQPIVVYVGQRKLFEAVRESVYNHNIATNNRTLRGSPVGSIAPR